MKEQFLTNQQEDIRVIIGNLIEASCWFEVEPWPDGQYLITTKAEGHLRRAGVSADRIKVAA